MLTTNFYDELEKIDISWPPSAETFEDLFALNFKEILGVGEIRISRQIRAADRWGFLKPLLRWVKKMFYGEIVESLRGPLEKQNEFNRKIISLLEILKFQQNALEKKITQFEQNWQNLQESSEARLAAVDDFCHRLSRRLELLEIFDSEVLEKLANFEKGTSEKFQDLSGALAGAKAQLDNLQKIYSENYPRIDGLDSKLNQTDARLDLLENHLAGINASLSEQLEHLAATWGKNWPRVAELAGILNEGNKRLDNLEEERSAFNQSQSLVRLEALEKDFSAWRLGNFETEERIKILDKITSRWSSLLNQIRLLELKIKGQGPAGPKKQLAEKVSTVFPTDFDYLAFEDEFRTPPDLLKEHQKRYLKYFKKCRQVLDIGCGRGEFLELLKNNRINGSGVDSNELLVLEGRRKKLAVVLGKVPAYLDLLEADSLDGVFISHLVEHLSPQELVELILKVSLKMEKKAYLIIETVNPLSFFSLANFYLDLTHTRPVLPRTLEFLATRAGLKKESFELLSAVSEDLSLKKEGLGSQLILENFDKINRAIFGHRDYVLIFKK